MREETSTEKMDFVEMVGFVININTGRIFFHIKLQRLIKRKKVSYSSPNYKEYF